MGYPTFEPLLDTHPVEAKPHQGPFLLLRSPQGIPVHLKEKSRISLFVSLEPIRPVLAKVSHRRHRASPFLLSKIENLSSTPKPLKTKEKQEKGVEK